MPTKKGSGQEKVVELSKEEAEKIESKIAEEPKKIEASGAVEVIEPEPVPVKVIRTVKGTELVKVKRKYKAYIGGTRYRFEPGKVYKVSLEIAMRLRNAGILVA